MKRFLLAAGLILFPAAAFAQVPVVSPVRPSIDISGTVTAGGTYQTVAVANKNRFVCVIQNPSTATEPLDIELIPGGTAMAQPFTLAAGSTWSSGFASDAIEVTGATTGHAFAGVCQ